MMLSRVAVGQFLAPRSDQKNESHQRDPWPVRSAILPAGGGKGEPDDLSVRAFPGKYRLHNPSLVCLAVAAGGAVGAAALSGSA